MSDDIGKKIALLKKVYQVIALAAESSHRSSEAVRLIGVSKRKPIEDILSFRRAGLRDFGENYVQEFVEKYERLQDADITWHFIGHLQRNKVKYIIDKVHWIHTLDSLSLAEEIQKQAEKKGVDSVNCLIQVNIGREEQKGGVLPESVVQLIRDASSYDRLRIRGLMAIPPFLDAESLRPYHREMAALLRTATSELPDLSLTELSIGMSNDFDVAVEEGATMVRVGTLLFGERQ